MLSTLCATVLLVAYGCAGDHDRLKKDDAATGGEGGEGGGMGGALPTTTTGGGGTGGTIEPPGPPQLTFVNGTVDEDAIRVCFVPYPGGASNEMPWPEQDRMAYARGEAIALAAAIPNGTDVEIVLVAGALNDTIGRSCADLIDSPPIDVLARSVGVLPESVFTTEKSILLVSAGCIGGRDHSDANEEQICGLGYTVDQPTATLVAGFMSRLTASNKIPLQFVQASVGLSDVQLRIQPGNGATTQSVLTEWTFGAIAPYPPYLALGTEQLGGIAQTSIVLFANGSDSPIVSTAWGLAFSNSTLTENDVQNGVGLAFIAVGPTPTVTAGSWWNPFTYGVVLANP